MSDLFFFLGRRGRPTGISRRILFSNVQLGQICQKFRVFLLRLLGLGEIRGLFVVLFSLVLRSRDRYLIVLLWKFEGDVKRPFKSFIVKFVDHDVGEELSDLSSLFVE